MPAARTTTKARVSSEFKSILLKRLNQRDVPQGTLDRKAFGGLGGFKMIAGK
jgi:hypothetical protein